MRGAAALLAAAAGGCLIKPSPPSGSRFDANFVFVTSARLVPSQLGGLAGADARCNDLAAKAHLPGRYVAWLSSAQGPARDRLGNAQGWVRPDGQPFANTVDEMLAGKIFYPVMLDEHGQPVAAPDDFVATGTSDDGSLATDAQDHPLTCNDWTSDTGYGLAAGSALATTHQWNLTSVDPCTQQARLYCFGIDRAVAVAPPPVTATSRIAFVTSATFRSGTGLATATALCNTEAAVLTGHGSFVPLLATSMATARAAVTLGDRPFVRPDGVVAISVASGLHAFDAPINVTPDGLSYVDDHVFLGAADLDSLGDATCSDWMSSDGQMAGTVGLSAYMWPRGVFGFTDGCDQPRRVVCLEQ